MATFIPKTSAVLTALLRADFTTQWRNRRAVVLTLVVPVIILMAWKGMAANAGAFVLANSITIGLFASGLMGYSNTIARDRDKGIFQRLRVAPLRWWTIMASRLLVQLAMIMIITTIVFIIGNSFDGITLPPLAYLITYFTAIICGCVSLSLGQMIVGFIKNPETVNATTRLVYLALIMVGMFGEANHEIEKMEKKTTQLGDTIYNAVQLTPYGAVKTILSAGMEPTKWNNSTSTALLLTLAYILVFTFLGIKWFKWNTK